MERKTQTLPLCHCVTKTKLKWKTECRATFSNNNLKCFVSNVFVKEFCPSCIYIVASVHWSVHG